MNGVALTHWAGNCGGDDRERGSEVFDEILVGKDGVQCFFGDKHGRSARNVCCEIRFVFWIVGCGGGHRLKISAGFLVN